MSDTITTYGYSEVKLIAKQAIEEQGADKTAICKYVEGGKPECIGGVVLFKLGFDIDGLLSLGDGSFEGSFWAERAAERGIAFTPKARTFLEILQKAQDMGSTWGKAYKIAINHTNSHYIGDTN